MNYTNLKFNSKGFKNDEKFLKKNEIWAGRMMNFFRSSKIHHDEFIKNPEIPQNKYTLIKNISEKPNTIYPTDVLKKPKGCTPPFH